MQYLDWVAQNPVLSVIILLVLCVGISGIFHG
jgi:hypothetical protein